MTSVETYFTKENGKITYVEIDKFKNCIVCLPDGTYKNSIDKLYNKRSNKQNRYYWGIVLPELVKGFIEVGFECDNVESAHEWCKHKFLKEDKKKRKRAINKITGEIIYLIKYPTTTKLSTVLFNEYFEKIIVFAAEYLSIEIPYPNEEISEKL